MIVRQGKTKYVSPSRKLKKLPRWLVPGLVITGGVLTVILLAVLLGKPTGIDAPSGRPLVNVHVEQVVPVPVVEDVFQINGVVEPLRTVSIAAEVAGQVEGRGPADRPLEKGDHVEVGDIILRINTELLQADYNRYDAQRQFDEADLERVIELNRVRAATDREVEEARTRLQISQAAYESARAQLRRSTITSPIPGYVNSLPVEAGEYVTSGTVVADIVQDDPVKVIVHVPERNISYLKIGDTHRIVDKLGGSIFASNNNIDESHTWEGTITFISATADTATHTTRIELTVPNPRQSPQRLRAGQIVLARLLRQVHTDAIMVPLRVLIPQPMNGQQRYVVFVEEDGIAQQRVVTPGQIRDDMVMIVGGDLEPGEMLITEGHRYIGPGQPVRIVPASEANW